MNRSLGVKGVVLPRWIEVRIGGAKVDGAYTGGAGISKPGDLNRRRLARKRKKTTVGHVHREIDEDVDTILAHRLRDLVIALSDGNAPRIGIRAESFSDAIGS